MDGFIKQLQIADCLDINRNLTTPRAEFPKPKKSTKLEVESKYGDNISDKEMDDILLYGDQTLYGHVDICSCGKRIYVPGSASHQAAWLARRINSKDVDSYKRSRKCAECEAIFKII